MQKVNIPMLLLSLLVVSMFILVGLAIAYRNIWLVLLFLFLGFAIMSFGISLKRKRESGV